MFNELNFTFKAGFINKRVSPQNSELVSDFLPFVIESTYKPTHQPTNDTRLPNASPTEGISENDSETESRNEEGLENLDIETN